MGAVKDNNFIAIQGWMRTRLNLKGNELLIYALIYGFSQDGQSRFTGSRKYIADWCGCSLDTVDRSLNSLVSKGLLTKYPHTDQNGSRVVDYASILTATAPSPAHALATAHSQAPAQDPWAGTANASTEQFQTPAADPKPLLDEPQTPPQPKEPDPTEEVVDHLNQRAGTHYKATTANTRKLIKARLKEGFTVDEIKLVIDKKCADWLNNPAMVEYLRPETLFGSKFESYLNAKSRPQFNLNAYTNTNANPNTAAQPIDADGHMAKCTRENGWF